MTEIREEETEIREEELLIETIDLVIKRTEDKELIHILTNIRNFLENLLE